ncbi:Mitochondrial oxaloacetate carrier protein [Rhizina undulata]
MAIAAYGAVTVTHGSEMVKTGELAAKSQPKHLFTGVFQDVTAIRQKRRLLRSPRWSETLGSAYCYSTMLKGYRLGFYEPIRTRLDTIVHNDASTQFLAVNF